MEGIEAFVRRFATAATTTVTAAGSTAGTSAGEGDDGVDEALEERRILRGEACRVSRHKEHLREGPQRVLRKPVASTAFTAFATAM